MSEHCERAHTMLSDGKLEPNASGGTVFVPGAFPDLVFGHGDTEEEARKDAKKKARVAAAQFCAKKKCNDAAECIWSDITSRFDAVMEYSTPDKGCVAMLRIEVIECKCKKS